MRGRASASIWTQQRAAAPLSGELLELQPVTVAQSEQNPRTMPGRSSALMPPPLADLR